MPCSSILKEKTRSGIRKKRKKLIPTFEINNKKQSATKNREYFY